MSLESAPVVAQPGFRSSSSKAMAVAWARFVGAGSLRRDFGHSIATNAAGEVLLAARLERLDGDALTGDAAPASDAHTAGAARTPAESPPGRLLKLAPGGGPVWTLLLRGPAPLTAPAVALDGAGAAYIAGPYEPDDAGFRASPLVLLTKLGKGGAAEWSRPLFPSREASRPGIPLARVAVDPAGGACVTWLGRRRGSPVVRALRLSSEGSIEWEHAWLITDVAFDPHVSLDDAGGALVWGSFRGGVAFAADRAVRSPVDARYLARVEPDGRISWSSVLPLEWDAPCGVAVGPTGAIGLLIAVQSPARDGQSARRGFVLLRSNAAGGALKRLHGVCNAHGLISSLHLAPSAGDAFVLAGSFSGVLTLENEALRSPTQASEAVFAVHAGPDGGTSSLVLPVPQVWGGLSVHDAGDGGALVAGWMCGAATFGEHRIASPRDRAVLFLVKLAKS